MHFFWSSSSSVLIRTTTILDGLASTALVSLAFSINNRRPTEHRWLIEQFTEVKLVEPIHNRLFWSELSKQSRTPDSACLKIKYLLQTLSFLVKKGFPLRRWREAVSWLTQKALLVTHFVQKYSRESFRKSFDWLPTMPNSVGNRRRPSVRSGCLQTSRRKHIDKVTWFTCQNGWCIQSGRNNANLSRGFSCSGT